MEEFIYYNELYLIYKDLLNEQEKDIFNLYYGENLSMQEIADIRNISKARVGIIIKNVTNELDRFESSLHINKNNKEIDNIMKIDDIDKIKKEISKLYKGE